MADLLNLTAMCSNETDGQACFWEYGDKGGVLYREYDSCSSTAILLPGFNLLPNWFLAIVYGLTLIWSFFGIAIISDTFMSAIEVITSLEREVKSRGNDGTEITLKVLVWNASVANLTLMALGSSAPEIMIAVIETLVTLGRQPGELGPSTIVGSAAFNLLLISAVCIIAVPEGQYKSISQFSVFLWTAFMSLFAYFWMLVVYKFWTPDEVTVVEAVLTILFLPLLVIVAYVLDRKPWNPKTEDGSDDSQLNRPHLYQVIVGAHGAGATGQEYTVTKEEIDTYLSYHSHLGKEMEESQIAQIIAEGRFHRTNSDPVGMVPARPRPLHASFREGSMRQTLSSTGGASDVDPTPSVPPWYERTSIDRTTVMQQLEELRSRRERIGLDPNISEEDIQSVVRAVQSKQAKNDMSALQYRINARNALTGRTHLAVAYQSASQTAARGTDLKRSSAPPTSDLDQVPKLMFASEEYRVLESQRGLRVMVHCARPSQAKDTTVTVNYTTRDGSARGGDDYAATSGQLRFAPGVSTQVIDIVVFEDDLVEDDEDFFVELSEPSPSIVHIQKPVARVTIVDTTESGVVQFPHTHISVKRTKDIVQVPVIRKGGCNGAVTVNYVTQTDTAAAGIDFEHTSGQITFESGESQKTISVPLIGTPKTGSFTLCLKTVDEDHSPGVQISRRRALCSIEIVSDQSADNVNTLVDRILENQDSSEGSYVADWVQQFRDAVIPGRELDEEGEPQDLQTSNIIFHYISITWKLLFAIVPPPEMYDGGPCFFVSLMMIGGLTYFVAPIASMFGCAVGLSDLMTAIVFVAVGTSLPDTFASHQAAVQAEDADAAIGNVTGSNCVNVFLGLGFPWLIATLYYQARGQRYLTPAGPLSFSVMIFMISASVCLVLLMVKRFRGGELGGRGFWRSGIAVIFFLLWLFYLIMSGLQDTGKIEWSNRR